MILRSSAPAGSMSFSNRAAKTVENNAEYNPDVNIIETHFDTFLLESLL